jgi:nicotinamidase-related amidase
MKGAPLPPFAANNTAFVVHDMQNDFLKDWKSKPDMTEVVKKTKALVDLCRSLSIPIVYTRVEIDPAYSPPPDRAPYLRASGPPICVKGTPGAEIIDELKPTDKDFVFTKARTSAFYLTKLEQLLRVKDIWILIVVGGATSWGVEMLVRDAKVRDIVPVVLRDLTYGITPEAHEASLANIDHHIGYVMTSDDVKKKLEALKK